VEVIAAEIHGIGVFAERCRREHPEPAPLPVQIGILPFQGVVYLNTRIVHRSVLVVKCPDRVKMNLQRGKEG